MADSEVRQKFEAWWKSATEGVESLVGLSVNPFDAFEAGMRAGEIARWIPVEEKLPDEGQMVLCFGAAWNIETYPCPLARSFNPDDPKLWFDMPTDFWQPLPAAPEEKK